MNKKEIEKIKKDLEKERAALVSEVENIKEREVTLANSEVGDDIDKAAESSQREILFFISDHDRLRLNEIDEALQKIKEERYGICESCGKKIQIERLSAIPYARLCIHCKPSIEGNQ